MAIFRTVSRIPVALFVTCGAIAWCQPALYVTNQNSNSVSVVDSRTGNVNANLPVSFSPAGVALTPDGARLLVASPNGNVLNIYATATNTSVGTISIGVAPMAVAADAARVYVALRDNAALVAYNSTSFAQQAALRVGFGPVAIAISPGSDGRVYVANNISNTVSIVDPSRIGTANNPVLANISVPAGPVGLAMRPGGAGLWVLSTGQPTLSHIDLSRGTIDRRIPLPGVEPAGITLAPDDTRLYVTAYGPRVVVVDAAAGTIRSGITLPSCPQVRCVALGSAISADGRTLWVANSSRNQINVVNTDTGQVTSSITTQESPRGIVLAAAPQAASATVAEVRQ